MDYLSRFTGALENELMYQKWACGVHMIIQNIPRKQQPSSFSDKKKNETNAFPSLYIAESDWHGLEQFGIAWV